MPCLLSLQSDHWLPHNHFFRDLMKMADSARRMLPEFRPEGPTSDCPQQRSSLLSRADMEAIHAVLLQQNRGWDAHDAALENITALGSDGALVIMGQVPPEPFGGSGRSLWKAISVMAATQRWSNRVDGSVIPVLWVGDAMPDSSPPGLSLLDRMFRLHRLPPISAEVFPDQDGFAFDVHQQVGQLHEWLPSSVLGSSSFRRLVALGESSSSVSDWYCRWMSDCFSSMGLVVVQGDDPAWRSLTLPIVKRILVRQSRLMMEANSVEHELRQHGYVGGRSFEVDETDLYLWWQHQPRQILSEGNTFALEGVDEVFPVRDFMGFLNEEAGALQPGSVVAPLIQQYLLSVGVRVIDFSEAPFYAQGRTLSQWFSIPAPALLPQAPIIWLDSRLADSIESREDGVEQLGQAEPESVSDLFLQWQEEEWQSLNVEELLLDFQRDFLQQHESFCDELVCQLPSLASLVKENRERIRLELNYLREKMEQHGRRFQVDGTHRLRYLVNSLRPHGGLQEELAVLSFWDSLTKESWNSLVSCLASAPTWEHPLWLKGND